MTPPAHLNKKPTFRVPQNVQSNFSDSSVDPMISHWDLGLGGRNHTGRSVFELFSEPKLNLSGLNLKVNLPSILEINSYAEKLEGRSLFGFSEFFKIERIVGAGLIKREELRNFPTEGSFVCALLRASVLLQNTPQRNVMSLGGSVGSIPGPSFPSEGITTSAMVYIKYDFSEKRWSLGFSVNPTVHSEDNDAISLLEKTLQEQYFTSVTKALLFMQDQGFVAAVGRLKELGVLEFIDDYQRRRN